MRVPGGARREQRIATVETTERRRLIELYRDGARAVAEAVASLSKSDLDRFGEDKQTARQLIHHIADSELVEGLHLRRILSEENPVFARIDEDEQERRSSFERSLDTSVGVLQGVMLANLACLERLREDEWLRTGQDSRDGAYSVEDWLRRMSRHARDHVAQMLRAAGHSAN